MALMDFGLWNCIWCRREADMDLVAPGTDQDTRDFDAFGTEQAAEGSYPFRVLQKSMRHQTLHDRRGSTQRRSTSIALTSRRSSSRSRRRQTMVWVTGEKSGARDWCDRHLTSRSSSLRTRQTAENGPDGELGSGRSWSPRGRADAGVWRFAGLYRRQATRRTVSSSPASRLSSSRWRERSGRSEPGVHIGHLLGLETDFSQAE